MVYGSEAMSPAEIRQTSARVEAYGERNSEARAQELDLVKEIREMAVIRVETYRSRDLHAYNKRIRPRDFQIGDLVLKKAYGSMQGLYLIPVASTLTQ